MSPSYHISQLPTTKEWWNFSAQSPVRSLPQNLEAPSPYHDGPQSPLAQLPHGDDPRTIKVDLAHTWAIVGFGKDDAASCIMFLAVHCKVWRRFRGFETALEHAWGAFREWGIKNQRYTTIPSFDKQELKIKSFLVFIILGP